MQKKSNLPLVSVIVPFYNEEKHIEQCLQTLKKQTYSKVQLIAVDDGSTDSSRKIAKKYVDILLVQKHQGPGVARNKAARVAKGEILIFADADMYFDINYIKMLLKPIFEKKAIATFTNEEYVANTENFWAKCFQIDNGIPLKNRIRTRETRIKKFRAITKSGFFKTKGYGTDTGYGEDNVLDKRESVAAKGAICFHYNPDSLSDVFLSARWVGRSKFLSPSLRNLLKYSLLNSIRLSFKIVAKGGPFTFFIYKFVFDFGVFEGILRKNKEGGYSK
ncbi:MAG TPA: glycosyltransferase family 2 protein [Patescibacteria group bacterium]|nr:glycosyltransferase family 2 protein [Patescibacteria group bacterium]